MNSYLYFRANSNYGYYYNVNASYDIRKTENEFNRNEIYIKFNKKDFEKMIYKNITVEDTEEIGDCGRRTGCGCQTQNS